MTPVMCTLAHPAKNPENNYLSRNDSINRCKYLRLSPVNAVKPLQLLLLACWCLATGPVLGQSTQQPPQDTTDQAQARQEASVAIAENEQGTLLLRKLLEGRKFQFFGRLEGEFAFYDIPSLDQQDGADLRRFRAGIAGVSALFDRLSYKLEFDLMDQTSTISSAYITADFGKNGTLTIGNQDGSQSLNASTGSLSQLFMEAPLPIEAFGVSKRVGISYDRASDRNGLHFLIFGRDLNSEARHQGISARAYFNPYRSEKGIWHFGISALREDITDETRLRSRPESYITDIRLVDTGWFEDVKSTRRLGLEIAGATGSFTTRFEFLRNDWKRDDGTRNRFKGAYLEGGYFFSGIPFRYVRGKFVRPRLAGVDMAWELAYRLSWVDLNDDDVEGGEELNTGLALNAYPHPGWRGQVNLIYVDSDRPDSDGLLFQARLQWNW